MTIEKVLPLVVAVLYCLTGVIHARQGNYASAGMWASYALANCFVIYACSK